MASASIRVRENGGGKRYEIVYRLGGRYFRQKTAGTFKERDLAERRLRVVKNLIADGIDPEIGLFRVQRPADLPRGCYWLLGGRFCNDKPVVKIGLQAFCEYHADELREVFDQSERVYFAVRDGLVKIGFSHNPVSRAAEVGGEMVAMERGGRRRERALHLQFAEWRQHGEWFLLGEPLLAYLEAKHGWKPTRAQLKAALQVLV